MKPSLKPSHLIPHRRYPKSFARLLLLGFALVALPLAVAIGYALVTIQGIAEQSERAVQRATKSTQGSRQLAESMIGMERVLRQYLVVREPILADDYQRLRSEFRSVLSDMSTLGMDAENTARLRAVLDRDEKLAAMVSEFGESQMQMRQPDELIDEFLHLADDVLPVVEAGRNVADVEVANLEHAASRARDRLLLPLAAAVLVALAIGWWFQRLISAQVRQFDQAIRAIGRGDYGAPIAVSGPEDMAFLGQRLDWLRQRLGELEEQKGRFLRHASHDLKTPLTAIREGAQLLSDSVPGELNEQQRSIVGIMMQNALRLQRLIEELLNYQQAGLAADHLDLQPVAFDALVDQVLHAHRLAAASRGLRFQTVLPPVQIDGDAEKLRVVIDNLVTNAIKFSPREGVVRVRLGSDEGNAVLDVIDDGPGVPEAEREKIFDAFFRGTRTREGVEGSGLGLAIAREYVAAHFGRIEYVSQAGEGAHFRVNLPKVRKERLK